MKALKIVKHLPKNEEQNLLKEGELKVQLAESRASDRKLLKANEKAREQKEKSRAAEKAAISDVSEVETVREPKSFFNVDINLDNLKVELDNIKAMIAG